MSASGPSGPLVYYYYPPIYTINIGTRKRLHDISRFFILFLGQEILITRSTSGLASYRFVGVYMYHEAIT